MAIMSRADEAMRAVILGWILGWGTGAVRAVVLMKGWEWFVADTFGVPTIGFVATWGLSMLIAFATMHWNPSGNKERPYVVMATGLILSLILSASCFVSLLILSGWR